MGRSRCCDKEGLKKGPWTSEEDQKLLSCIQEHGCGSWRSLPGKAGLQRCGKSCRLRWNNYLRPDIKRGKFSLQEERSIIQLHALLGNRWSAIAANLPSRTDNEIKNHWNTRLKKRLTKMGIDPVTHKPLSQSKYVANLSHMADWESARLEAEARLVRRSYTKHPKITLFNQNYMMKHTTTSQPYYQLPCLDILKAWQTRTSTVNSIHLEDFAAKNIESSRSVEATPTVGENVPSSTMANEFSSDVSSFMQELSDLIPEYNQDSKKFYTTQLDMGSDFESDENMFNWNNNFPCLITSTPFGSLVPF